VKIGRVFISADLCYNDTSHDEDKINQASEKFGGQTGALAR